MGAVGLGGSSLNGTSDGPGRGASNSQLLLEAAVNISTPGSSDIDKERGVYLENKIQCKARSALLSWSTLWAQGGSALEMACRICG